MYTSATLTKPISTLLIIVIISMQVLTVSTALLIPKPAKAILGFGDLVIKIGDVYDVLKDVGIAAGKAVAMKIAEKFISRFTTKLVEKYKIRNYLYYDQVLTNYYLTRFISDKIQDPDLRQIYGLMEAAYITGADTGLNGQPDRQNAVMVRLYDAIDRKYEKLGGIPTNAVLYPDPNQSDVDYYNTAYHYWMDNPGFYASYLNGAYAGYRNSANTAAKLEVIVGDSLKAGRFIGGVCKPNTGLYDLPGSSSGFIHDSPLDKFAGLLNKIGVIDIAHAQEPPPLESKPLPGSQPAVDGLTDPAKCAAAGGTWQQSALDQARSFIDNPTASMNKYLDGFIKRRIDSSFDPNSFAAVIGSLLGNFLFNQFTLDKPAGVLMEDPRGYEPVGADEGTGVGVEIDIDGDNISDGFDYTGDGEIDICKYGGEDGKSAGPPCLGSAENLDTGQIAGSKGNDQGAPFTIDESEIIWLDRDIGNWDVTTNLSVSFEDGNTKMCLDFDKTNDWPILGPDDIINANVWIVVWREGKWYAGTWEWIRPGEICKDSRMRGGDVDIPGAPEGGALEIDPLRDFYPVPGETYGFVVSGLARAGTSNVKERSNVIMVTWPNVPPKEY